MSQASDSESFGYTVPDIVNHVGYALREPREAYSGKIVDLFATNRETQYAYCYGIIFVLGLMSMVYILWAVVMVVLKLKGKEVGCASGLPFPKESADMHDLGQFGSTDSSHSYSHNGDDDEMGSVGSYDSYGSDSRYSRDYDSRLGSHAGSSVSDNRPTNSARVQEKGGDDQSVVMSQGVERRQIRTRVAFLFFSTMACSLVPLTLLFSFGPLREALGSMDDILLSARETLNQVSVSASAVETAAINSAAIIAATPLDLDVICPNVPEDQLESILGIDLTELTVLLTDDYDELSAQVNDNVTNVQNTIGKIDRGIIRFEDTVDEVSDSLWLIPGILLAITLLVAVSMFGVLLAWRERSGPSLQHAMSYLFLPLMILILTVTWILVLFTAVGTIISSDLCSTSLSSGSPDQTIQEIMHHHNLNQNSTIYKFVNAYTNSCSGADPTDEINQIERDVQATIDTIWRLISTVDSIGRSQINAQCGGIGLDGTLDGARNLAKQLTSVRRALDSAGGSLECDRINPIYTKITHEMVCTQSASAMAYGFVLFTALSICMMVMVALRASWLVSIVEEKVYHNEDEVAENMILDEHEEYLEYISRYKHEWQEYQGFDEKKSLRGSEHSLISYDDFDDEGSASVYFENDEEGSRTDGEGYHASDENSLGKRMQYDTAPSMLSIPGSVSDGANLQMAALDDISFTSLPISRSDDDSFDDEDNIGNDASMMPSLLSPPTNPEFNKSMERDNGDLNESYGETHDDSEMEKHLASAPPPPPPPPSAARKSEVEQEQTVKQSSSGEMSKKSRGSRSSRSSRSRARSVRTDLEQTETQDIEVSFSENQDVATISVARAVPADVLPPRSSAKARPPSESYPIAAKSSSSITGSSITKAAATSMNKRAVTPNNLPSRVRSNPTF